MSAERPADVILDVEFEAGLLYLCLRNIGEGPASAVRCKFAQPFHGLGGATDMSALPLFRKLEFLGPGREIRTLLDTASAYFTRKEPVKLEVTVTWRDDVRARSQRAIVHDLSVYRAVAYRA